MAKGKQQNTGKEKAEKIMNQLYKTPKWKRLVATIACIVLLAFVINDVCNLGILPTFAEIENAVSIDKVTVLPYESQVHIVDVGQGDCTLIKQGDSYALIDAGERDQGEIVVRYLQSIGVTKLDYIIVTHMHTDHMGGMQAVLENIDVGTVILPDMTLVPMPTAPTVMKFFETLDSINNKVAIAKTEDVYELGSGKITIVTTGIVSDSQNNNSVGVLFEAEGLSFLNTGDGEKDYEINLLQTYSLQPVTIFAAGHHGSSTSNTAELLYTIQPQYIAISCSADNDYGHPHKEPMQLFERLKCNILRTDKCGSIIFAVDENGETVVVCEREA